MDDNPNIVHDGYSLNRRLAFLSLSIIQLGVANLMDFVSVIWYEAVK
jgi:hypothetical protein